MDPLNFDPEELAGQIIQQLIQSGLLDQFTQQYKQALSSIVGDQFSGHQDIVDETINHLVQAMVQTIVVVVVKTVLTSQLQMLKQVIDAILALIPGQ